MIIKCYACYRPLPPGLDLLHGLATARYRLASTFFTGLFVCLVGAASIKFCTQRFDDERIQTDARIY